MSGQTQKQSLYRTEIERSWSKFVTQVLVIVTQAILLGSLEVQIHGKHL